MPETTSETVVESELARCIRLSKAMRRALRDYNLLPTHFLLAQHLVLESYDLGLVRAPIKLREWAEQLGMREAKGLRDDKLEKLLLELKALGLVDLVLEKEEGEKGGQERVVGCFELRPDAGGWSKDRGLRRKPAVQCAAGQDTFELSARPLSEALSEVSRENALAGVAPVPVPTDKDWPTLFSRLREALNKNDAAALAALKAELTARSPESELVAVSAEKSADASAEFAELCRRKIPPTHDVPVKPSGKGGSSMSAENSAETPSYKAESAFKKRANSANQVPSADFSAEKAIEWLVSVDSKGHLAEERLVYYQWVELCERDPEYVLRCLRRDLEHRRLRDEQDRKAGRRNRPVADALAWLSVRARHERQLRPLGRRPD